MINLFRDIVCYTYEIWSDMVWEFLVFVMRDSHQNLCDKAKDKQMLSPTHCDDKLTDSCL